MDYDFWETCWQKPSQPFHLAEAHTFLKKYLHLFKANEKILLPLSGKSVDPLFLTKNGFESTSIEFNPKAVEGFIKENDLEFKSSDEAEHKHFQFDGFEIWLADFFKLSKEKTGTFSQVFDRAALVALPEELRAKYAKHLQALLNPNAIILVATMDYDTSEMSGPPFYISLDELKTHFPSAIITELDRQSLMDNHPRWKELELTSLDEVLYQVQL